MHRPKNNYKPKRGITTKKSVLEQCWGKKKNKKNPRHFVGITTFENGFNRKKMVIKIVYKVLELFFY